jgi:hypothetical protein
MLNVFLRSDNENPLTHEQMDSNFKNLANAYKSHGEASESNGFNPILGYLEVPDMSNGESVYVEAKATVVGYGNISGIYEVFLEDDTVFINSLELESDIATEYEVSIEVNYINDWVVEIRLNLLNSIGKNYFSQMQIISEYEQQVLPDNEDPMLQNIE